MTIQDLFTWMKTNRPTVVESWGKCSHFYSPSHPSTYHLEDSLLNHQMMIFQQCQEKQTSLLGNIACLCHDLGKPFTRELNHEAKRASMMNHESVSAFMAIEIMESLSHEFSLTTEDKINIFFAICYHIDFHMVMSSCLKKDINNPDRFKEFVDRYQGQPEMARILVELGVCDSLGRKSDPLISPINPELNTLIKTLDNSNVYSELSKNKTKKEKNKPIIEMLIGLPCSGKTKYGRERKGFNVIERDLIVIDQTKADNTKEAYENINLDKVNQAFDKALKSAIREKSHILIDNNNFIKSQRKSILSQCKGYHKKAVLFLDSLTDITERNVVRMDNGGKEENILNMTKDFTPPSFNEFDEIIVIYKDKKIKL